MKSKGFHRLRWAIMTASYFFMSYGVRILGTWLTDIALPIFSCTIVTENAVATICYDFSHLSWFLRNGITWSVISYLLTFVILAIVFGRMFCGFICPMGYLQDLAWKVSDILHIEKFTRKEKFVEILKACRFIVLMTFVFMSLLIGDFCNYCPAVISAPAFAGVKIHFTVGYFLGALVMILSVFMRRFWCNICPIGYLLGLLHRVSFFRIKKDCTSCTYCGACYEACPMRIKTIYTEKEKDDVTATECIFCGECVRKCPENNGLSVAFLKFRFYKASREDFENNQLLQLRRMAELEKRSQERALKKKRRENAQ